jgi:hypothetical protein
MVAAYLLAIMISFLLAHGSGGHSLTEIGWTD